jgi:hypothetical protein
MGFPDCSGSADHRVLLVLVYYARLWHYGRWLSARPPILFDLYVALGMPEIRRVHTERTTLRVLSATLLLMAAANIVKTHYTYSVDLKDMFVCQLGRCAVLSSWQ